MVEDGKLFSTEEGTPQGGVISPLLANITLHGMETDLRKAFPVAKKLSDGKRMNPYAPMVIRYADDLVIIHPELKEVIKAKELLEKWLEPYGLKLKAEKTKIVHTLDTHEGQKPGFDFLGFNVRQHRASKGRGAKSPDGSRLGYMTIITPSKESIRKFKTKLKEIVVRNYSGRQENLIRLLNPIIRGWANYFRTENSSGVFHVVDHNIFQMFWGWAVRRHRDKGKRWIYAKYWRRFDGAIRFTGVIGNPLLEASRVGKRYYVKIQGNRSPFDGDWVYWSRRMSTSPKWAPREFKILMAQKGRCAMCNLYFKAGDLIEFDHKIPTRLGGKNTIENLQALHRHCHDRKTAVDGSMGQPSVNEE
jgi:RNA-directed DNA polymerase